MLENNKYLPFTRQLLKLSSQDLSGDEFDLLGEMIDLLVSKLDNGHSCLILNDYSAKLGIISLSQLIEILKRSDLVAIFEKPNQLLMLKPLSLLVINSVKPQYLLYITRYLYYENKVAELINKLNQPSHLDLSVVNQYLDQLQPHNGFPNNEQLNAIKLSATQMLNIIAGGPGTGKTTSVVLILWLLNKVYQENKDKLRIHICAPTGKAVKRVEQSISQSLELLIKEFQFNVDGFTGNLHYTTIHKLLGYKSNSIYFRHNKDSLLAIDILIIDESSMISLPLFYKLLSAIDLKQIKHIIFLGDKDQLSSVEEGYVFASLITYFSNSKSDLLTLCPYSELIQSKRSNTNINQLAQSIKYAKVDEVFECLNNLPELSLKDVVFEVILANLFDTRNKGYNLYSYSQYLRGIIYDETIDLVKVVEKIFTKFNQLAVLCLTNNGLFGVNNLNLHIETRIKQILQINDIWYTGRPIIILENDYNLNLSNGDIGICCMRNDQVTIMFADGREFIAEILPKYQVAYALTIHKSQGSEFENVTIVLAPNQFLDNYSNLLTRELIYTAVTRAKSRVDLYSGKKILQHMIENKTKRDSGLVYLLDNLKNII